MYGVRARCVLLALYIYLALYSYLFIHLSFEINNRDNFNDELVVVMVSNISEDIVK